MTATAPRLRFTRRKELDRLRRLHDAGSVRVVCVHGEAAVGKTTLVRDWLEGQFEAGLDRPVWAWAAPGQGGAFRGPSDRPVFVGAVTEKLIELHAEGTLLGDAGERGRALARILAASDAVVLLDGVEVFLTDSSGSVADRALAGFLDELLGEAAGFCVLTSRLPLPDDRITHISVAPLSTAQLRREAGGERAVVERAIKDLGRSVGYPLYLNLFIQAAKSAESFERARWHLAQGRAGAGMLDMAWEGLTSAERQLLLLMGLFEEDSGIETSALTAVTGGQGHALPGLTDALVDHDADTIEAALGRLEVVGLLRRRDGLAEIHPEVWAYLQPRLEQTGEGRRLGYRRLFEHYAAPIAGEAVESVPVVMRLMRAVRYGCRAGCHKSALSVYWAGVQREQGGPDLASYRLGLIDPNLTTLAWFFAIPWSQWAESGATGERLSEEDRLSVIYVASYDLFHACRFVEAEEAFAEMGRIATELVSCGRKIHWSKATSATRLVGEIDLVRGRLHGLAERLAPLVAEVDQLVREVPEKRLVGIATHGLLGKAHHYSGRVAEAEAEFTLITAVPAEDPGFDSWACDFWLDSGQVERSLRRLGVAFRVWQAADWSLHKGQWYTTLTRAALIRAAETGEVDVGLVSHWAHLADYHYRASGQIPHRPLSLSVCEQWHMLTAFLRGHEDASLDRDPHLSHLERLTREFDLGLFRVDAELLRSVRLNARGLFAGARARLAEAERLIEETGYFRRNRAVAGIRKVLGKRDALYLLSCDRTVYRSEVVHVGASEQTRWFEAREVPVRTQLINDALGHPSVEVRVRAIGLLAEAAEHDSAFAGRSASTLASVSVADPVAEVRAAALVGLRRAANADAVTGAHLAEVVNQLRHLSPDPLDDLAFLRPPSAETVHALLARPWLEDPAVEALKGVAGLGRVLAVLPEAERGEIRVKLAELAERHPIDSVREAAGARLSALRFIERIPLEPANLAQAETVRLDKDVAALKAIPATASPAELAAVLKPLAGRSFDNYEANKAVCREITAALRRSGCKLQCTTCGKPGIIRARPAGRMKTGSFQFEHYAESRQTFHGGWGRIPELTPIADPRRK